MLLKKYVVGIDIGGTNIRAGMLDEDYHLKNFVIESSEQIQSDTFAVEKLIDFVMDYLKSYDLNREVCAISIGFPSTIDRECKKVLSTPNVIGFENVNVVDMFMERIEIPTYINKDVNMLLLFDMYNGKIPEEGITTGFYMGTGLGNAIAIEGQILRGRNGAAAELGHIPSRNMQGECGCGNKTCVELFASGKHLKYLCDTYFKGTFIGDLFKKHSEHEILQTFVNDLAIPVATEINILDPDYIILGGGLPQMEGFPRELLEKAIRRYTRKPYPEENLEFIYSVPEQENGVVGAGVYAFKQMKIEESK